MKITVLQYYKGFKSLYGAIATVPVIVPALRLFMSDSNAVAGYLFPPLGDVRRLLLTITMAILLVITFVVFAFCRGVRKVPSKLFLALLGGVLIGPVTLIPLYTSFVRQVEVPSVNEEVLVSIGYQRTAFALQNYPEEKWPDWQILQDRGPWEEQIQRIWTKSSISVVRMLLWFFYFLFLACITSVGCLAVYQHVLERAATQPT